MADVTRFTPVDENAILKEVWDTHQISAKTQLDGQQIQSVNKLMSMAKLFGNSFLEDNVKHFMVLQKSLNRQSMGEFVNVVHKKQIDPMTSGILNKFMG